MYGCCIYAVPEEDRRGHESSYNWVLVIEPGSSARTGGAITTELSHLSSLRCLLLMSAAFSALFTNTGSSLRLRPGTHHTLIYHTQAWSMNHTGTNIPCVKIFLHRLVRDGSA